MTDSNEIRSDLSKLFAYRAEWLKEKLFDLFTEPSYFPELDSDVPIVLIGGRGTGKTTVLRGLSYQGKFALSDGKKSTVRDWPKIGFYYRVDTNRVTAFAGSEVDKIRWQKLFGHYMNLVFSDLVLEFIQWYRDFAANEVSLSEESVVLFSKSLCMAESKTVDEARVNLTNAIVEFESHINNIADEEPIKLSLQGAPVNRLIQSISELEEFDGKTFSFLIDEYENLNFEQQQVVNTLIKHASDRHTFKIGVRELGWRCKTTLNPDEQLQSPADYRLINISDRLEGNFAHFAEKVCDTRMQRLRAAYPDQNIPESIALMFPGITQEEEATKLGAVVQATKLREEINSANTEALDFFDSLSPLRQCFLNFRAEGSNIPLEDVVNQARSDSSWESKFNNNSHALLFTLHKRKRGIQKFYCGWKVFALLANTNVRYLIELVDTSISTHFEEGFNFSEPISPETQTLAAQKVGKKNLAELEGLSIHGAKLTKMLLGLGRVFGIMAKDAVGHAPEVNQFELSDQLVPEDVKDLIRSGVMHLALNRYSGTKMSGTDTKDYDYAVHPIFAPYFIFSHRKKRKMKISAEELLLLTTNAKKGIKSILSGSKRELPEELPYQLSLFENYYDGNS